MIILVDKEKYTGLKQGKEYELLIEKIYKDLEPDAVIKQDDYIDGLDSGIKRQIDLSIRSKIAIADILVIVQAKDYKNKADVNVIGDFVTIIRDVRAHKGIIICNSGFTKKATEYAKREGIELYSAHSAVNKRWDIELKIPIVMAIPQINFDSHAKFKTRSSFALTFRAPMVLSQDKGKTKINAMQYLMHKTKGQLLDKSGKKNAFNFKNPDVDLSNYPNNPAWLDLMELNISYTVVKTAYFINYYSPSDYRSLKDHLNDKTINTYVNYDDLLNVLRLEKWEKIKAPNEIALGQQATYVDMNYFQSDGVTFVNYEIIGQSN
jgi:Restriction endonuclease